MSSRKLGPRPSDHRREELKKLIPSSLSNLHNPLIPIHRYYEIADKVLQTFEDAHMSGNLDKAYIFGKRFSKISVELLPNHNYYRSSQKDLQSLRRKNCEDLRNVTDMLEIVVDVMDREEVERRKEEEKRKKEIEKAKRDRLLQRTRALQSVSKRDVNSLSEEEKVRRLEEKLNKLSSLKSNANEKRANGSEKDQSIRLSSHNDAIPCTQLQNEENDETMKEREPAPPSYSSVIGTTNHEMISEGAWLNENFEEEKKSDIPSQNTKKVPIRELKAKCSMEFSNMVNHNEINIETLSTYQGRVKLFQKDSTNGCTVISPLVAISHLTNPSAVLSNKAIEDVIDTRAPPILNAVRSKLGLPGNALIIPSDVHDYLVDEKILKQEMFVDVCGGNIIDSQHIAIFTNMLQNGVSSNKESVTGKDADPAWLRKKVGAVLFFHEHVISILKLNNINDGTDCNCAYELVDSLPHSRNGKFGGTRTRCKSIRSLEAALGNYACSKFTDLNCSYIDSNEWDETMCDFDPRVFQAFVWAV